MHFRFYIKLIYFKLKVRVTELKQFSFILIPPRPFPVELDDMRLSPPSELKCVQNS